MMKLFLIFFPSCCHEENLLQNHTNHKPTYFKRTGRKRKLAKQMSTKEECEAAINEVGLKIRKLKEDKPATLKDDLDPLVKELLALKLSFKEITGEDYGPPAKEKKEKGPSQKERQGEGPSKTELNKLAKKEAKAKAKAAARVESGQDAAPVQGKAAAAEGDDAFAHLYNDLPLIQSQVMTEKAYRQIQDINEKRVGLEIWLRGRVSNSRAVGKGCFLVLRQGISTVQAVMFQGENIPKAMVKYATSISLESGN